MKRFYLKVILINFLISLLLIVVLDIILGDWFNNNFNLKLSSERNINRSYQFNFTNYKGKSYYKRDKFGFRIDKNINPQQIKIVFLGGSTVNEKFTNYSETIVGIFENKLSKSNNSYKVANAGIDGMSIIGHINSFDYWFDKIDNFKPEFYIYYIGLNDSFLQLDNLRSVDLLEETSSLNRIKYFIISNSFFVKIYRNTVENINKKFNLNISINKIESKVYGERDPNRKFIKWNEMYDKNYKLSENDLKFKELYKEKLKVLNNLVKNRNGKIIFITQTSGYGLSERLYLIAETIMSFCENEKLLCINLAKDLELEQNDFYDWAHLTPKGSKKVANYIYKKILEKNFFFEKTKSIIIGKKVANKKDQKSNEFVKISLNIL